MGKRTNSHNNKHTRHDVRKNKQRKVSYLTWGGIGLLVLAVVGALIWFFSQSASTAQAAIGEVVPADSRDHIQLGSDPGTYPTDPPAGGHHYPSTYDPGFYSPQDVQSLPKFYSGYLVHNLEHGYVIFWYNCQADPKINCTDLQNAVKQVVQEKSNYKVIGFPWPSQKQPLVVTSWGRILRLNKIDVAAMRTFYAANVDKGPEQTPN